MENLDLSGSILTSGSLNTGDSPDSKKTLMNSLGMLKQKIEGLKELEKASNEILEKLYNPLSADQPEDIGKDEGKKAKSLNPTLIDLFDMVGEQMREKIIALKSNLSRISNMIE